MSQDTSPHKRSFDLDETAALLASLPNEEAEQAAAENARTDGDDTTGNSRPGRSLFSFLRLNRRQQKRRGHHRRKSSISQLMDSLSSMGENLAHDVVDTSHEVSTVFRSELTKADSGKRFFLEMGMTRSISILPEDLPEFVEEATGISVRHVLPSAIPEEEGEEEGEAAEPATKVEEALLPQPTKAFSLTPYLSLLGAVMAVSSNGTALSLLHDVSPALKIYWRMTSTALVLGLLTIRPLLKNDASWPQLSPAHWTTFLLCTTCFATQALLFVIAIQYTSIGNAVMFANSQAILLLIGKFFVGEPVVLMEAIGAFVAFSGAMLCSVDEGKEAARSKQYDGGDADVEEEVDMSTIGDLLALASAVLGVFYLTAAKALRPHMSVTIFMFLIMVCGSFIVLLYMLISGVHLTLDNHPMHGLFGWCNLRVDRLLLQLWIVLVCNLLGTMGFVRAMQQFDTLVIAVATLLEPMTASVIAYALAVGLLPGFMGWMGNLLVAVGTFGVVYSVRRQRRWKWRALVCKQISCMK